MPGSGAACHERRAPTGSRDGLPARTFQGALRALRAKRAGRVPGRTPTAAAAPSGGQRPRCSAAKTERSVPSPAPRRSTPRSCGEIPRSGQSPQFPAEQAAALARARRGRAGGRAHGGDAGVAEIEATHLQGAAVTPADFDGGAYVAWYDGPFLPRATHLLGDGRRSPAWSPGGDHLSDQLGDSQLGLVTDGFSGAYATWSEGRPPTGSFGMVLAQRLRPLGPASDELADTLGTGPPAVSDTLRVSILGCSPNPSHGVISVTVALPTNGPARVELLDLLGRRIETFDIGALGRGRHTVLLEVGRTTPTGIYVVRLSQGGRSSSAKVLHAS